MEYIQTDNGLRMLGMGQAVVIAVKSGTDDIHEVRINHPDVGDTPFIPYVQTAGMFKVPAIGDIVYVFCREGFANYPMAWGHKLHDSAVKALLGTRNNRATVIYSTAADNRTISHTIILDDGDNRGVRIKTAGGNSIEVKNTDDIVLTQLNGNTITMNAGGIELKAGGSTITMTPDSIKLSAGGSEMVMDSTVNIKASDTLTTIDKVVISTHDHKIGNLGYPTGGGPTQTGA